ncbi:MAG TPA: DMT family transporter [Candidatus Binatia bacterium]|nr:DMT family transporter [Candidatus Binatia bacterium]
MSRPVTVPREITASDKNLRRARLSLLLAAVLWSLAGIFIKFLSLPPLTIVFYRSLFASLFFAFFVRKSIAVPKVALGVSAVAYTAAISAFVSANKITTAANAIALQYTAPMFVFVIVRFLFGEKITRVSWISLVFGMLGIAVICAGSAGQPDTAGVMIALLSGLLFSIYMVSLRFLKEFNPGTLTFLNNMVCCLILLPLIGSELSLPQKEGWIVAVMGVVQLGIPYWLFSKGLEQISVQEASLIVLIEPVLNPIWVALIVGELPSGATLVGGIFIVGSLGFRYLWYSRNKNLAKHRSPEAM